MKIFQEGELIGNASSAGYNVSPYLQEISFTDNVKLFYGNCINGEFFYCDRFTFPIFAIQYIENPSEEICKLAVQEDVYSIRYLQNPSEEVQILAYNKLGYKVLNHFRCKPCQRLLDIIELEKILT